MKGESGETVGGRKPPPDLLEPVYSHYLHMLLYYGMWFVIAMTLLLAFAGAAILEMLEGSSNVDVLLWAAVIFAVFVPVTWIAVVNMGRALRGLEGVRRGEEGLRQWTYDMNLRERGFLRYLFWRDRGD